MGGSLPAEAIAHQQHPLARWGRVSAISATSPPPSIFSFFVLFYIPVFETAETFQILAPAMKPSGLLCIK